MGTSLNQVRRSRFTGHIYTIVRELKNEHGHDCAIIKFHFDAIWSNTVDYGWEGRYLMKVEGLGHDELISTKHDTKKTALGKCRDGKASYWDSHE